MHESPLAGQVADPARLVNVPALVSALEVMAANGVVVMVADKDEYTPTPAVSHAILAYNRGRTT